MCFFPSVRRNALLVRNMFSILAPKPEMMAEFCFDNSSREAGKTLQ